MPRPKIRSQAQLGDPWETLSGAIKVTLDNKQLDLRLSMIHKACSDLVNKGQLDLIFDGFSDLLKAHFVEWHNQLSTVAGDPLITKLSDQYEDFKNYCSIFPKFYMSYDRHFKEQPDKILNHIRKLFIQNILSDLKLFTTAATPSIIKVIYNAQKGFDVDLSKISSLIEMYYSFRGDKDVPAIFNDFIDKLTVQEYDFYNKFFENNYKGHSFTDYLNITAQQFNLDKRITEEIFEEKEATEFLSIFHSALLSDKEKEFLTGTEPAIAQALIADDLRPMRWLVETYFQFKADLKPIYTTCAEFIMNEMLKRTQDFPKIKKEEKGEKKPKTEEKDGTKTKAPKVDIFTVVSQLIDSTIKLSDPYLKVFNTKETTEQLEISIRQAWNDERFNIIENFNEYIDHLVKEEFNGFPSIDKECAVIARFYRYLSDKAKFKNLYESSFVRRLIKMRTKVANYDYPIINSIRKVTTDFMAHLDDFKKQFNDSEQLKDDYKKVVAEDPRANSVSIEPFVFSQSTFPLPKDEEFNIPALALETNSNFIKFYTEKHKQQMLILITSCSTVEFSFKVPSRNRTIKSYTITTDLPCGCVLSAVSQKPFKFSEIVNLLNHDRQLSSKVVQRLSEPKLRLLARKGASNKLSDEDEFSLNVSFSNSKVKLIVPPIVSERRSCREFTISKDENEKKDAVLAAIVRTLKQRGKAEIGSLERIVIDILHENFECTAEMVRRGITSAEGQYLRRDIVNGETVLTYIA